MNGKLYELALWYIGKCSEEEKKKYRTYQNEVKNLEQLTFKNVDKAYLIYGCDAQWQNFSRYEVLDNAIQRLAEYEALGTVEELKEAREKQIPQTPCIEGDGYADGHLVYDTWICPNCEAYYEIDYDDYDYCPKCGQAINKAVMEGSEEDE